MWGFVVTYKYILIQNFNFGLIFWYVAPKKRVLLISKTNSITFNLQQTSDVHKSSL